MKKKNEKKMFEEKENNSRKEYEEKKVLSLYMRKQRKMIPKRNINERECFKQSKIGRKARQRLKGKDKKQKKKSAKGKAEIPNIK